MKNIDDKEEYLIALRKAAFRLNALHNTVITLYAALELENVEQQALDAIECIDCCIKDIKNEIDKEASL